MTADQEGFIQKAQDSLRAARLLRENDLIDFAASRAYYAMFYVAEAFLIGRGLKFQKHGSLIAAFGQHFVKTGLIPAHFHQNLIKSYNKRISGGLHDQFKAYQNRSCHDDFASRRVSCLGRTDAGRVAACKPLPIRI